MLKQLKNAPLGEPKRTTKGIQREPMCSDVHLDLSSPASARLPAYVMQLCVNQNKARSAACVFRRTVLTLLNKQPRPILPGTEVTLTLRPPQFSQRCKTNKHNKKETEVCAFKYVFLFDALDFSTPKIVDDWTELHAAIVVDYFCLLRFEVLLMS